MPHRSGRHFLQIPGPTNVPDRVLRALSQPTMDHRGPEFAKLAREVLSGLQGVFLTKSPVIIYPGSGTGAWEASLVNTLSPGDKILMFETGHFAALWRDMGTRLGASGDGSPGLVFVDRYGRALAQLTVFADASKLMLQGRNGSVFTAPAE